jgi:transketolase
MYIRLGKNNEPFIHAKDDLVKFGEASIIKKGRDFALITTGNMLEQGKLWVDSWISEGYNPEFISMHTIKPIDEKAILSILDRGMNIITLEEHSIIGGLGSAISEIVAASGSSCKVARVGIPDIFSHHVGSQKEQREYYGLAARPDVHAIGILP